MRMSPTMNATITWQAIRRTLLTKEVLRTEKEKDLKTHAIKNWWQREDLE